MKNLSKFINDNIILESTDKNVIYDSDGLVIKSIGSINYSVNDGDEEGEMDINKSLDLNDYAEIGYRDEWSVIFDELEFYYNNTLYFTITNFSFDRGAMFEIWLTAEISNDSSIYTYTDFAKIYRIKNKLLSAISDIFLQLTNDEDEADVAYRQNKKYLNDILDAIRDVCEEDE